MFGDPVTPIFKAYIGDPVRIRFVHAAVKETHVFHLHLYEWHAVAGDRDSPRIDAISVSPQTGHTIEPVWGAGNRHQVAGDVIWHCHLYPHFHEGMWGMFRTFETRQDGPADRHGDPRELLADQSFPYTGRRLGRYPDGTPIEPLLPLPDRAPPPLPTPDRPGFPLYIPGEVRQKSPIPPWPDRELTPEERGLGANAGSPYEDVYRPPCHVTSLLARDMPADFDYRPVPTGPERLAFNDLPVPGELFTRNRLQKQQQQAWGADPRFPRNDARQVCHDVAVAMRDVAYNSHGWHDKHGHLYYLEAEGDPAARGGPMEPLFVRAQHGQIVNVTLRNALPPVIEETAFDRAFPPCPALAWEGECATHVHMVKFDPICTDGASVGWNYMSGARHGRRMVYRWWADQEFGTIFFHDHLFANHLQKHGLVYRLVSLSGPDGYSWKATGRRGVESAACGPVMPGRRAGRGGTHQQPAAAPGRARAGAVRAGGPSGAAGPAGLVPRVHARRPRHVRRHDQRRRERRPEPAPNGPAGRGEAGVRVGDGSVGRCGPGAAAGAGPAPGHGRLPEPPAPRADRGPRRPAEGRDPYPVDDGEATARAGAAAV